MDLKALYNRTIEQGGITFNRVGDVVEEKTGYVVSLPGLETQLRTLDFLTFREVVFQYGTLINQDPSLWCCVFGLWCDNGTWYVDVNQLIEDRDIAIRLAQHRKQLAIFDLENETTITIK